MSDHRKHLVDAGLERAAEALGDITAPVMAEFYRRHPEARASFRHHSPLDPAKLEAEMVGNTLYYVMIWHENRWEAGFAIDQSVPHHRVALDVPPDWFRGMIEALLDVVEPAAAPAPGEEQEAWQDLREGLTGLVERNRFV
ncbi:MAG: hypothetical protein KGL48_14875 [Sphingomonadales bacterium]|nr:hypothetical protein [Sphingomonadales bacterium]MDE2568919.1 hypothetical protein [Sphingomonadales bacterium]